MQVHRATIVLTGTLLALSAATGVAAAAGGHSTGAHDSQQRLAPSDLSAIVPWHREAPGPSSYRPHMICEEYNHQIMKDVRS